MSLLEAIIAIAIGFGAVAGALEAARMVAARAAIAGLETEAALRAENLLFEIGPVLPIKPGHQQGAEGDFEWSTDINAYLPSPKGPQAFDILVRVAIIRAGLTARAELATLKFVRETAP